MVGILFAPQEARASTIALHQTLLLPFSLASLMFSNALQLFCHCLSPQLFWSWSRWLILPSFAKESDKYPGRAPSQDHEVHSNCSLPVGYFCQCCQALGIRDFISVFSRRVSGFHRWGKASRLMVKLGGQNRPHSHSICLVRGP